MSVLSFSNICGFSKAEAGWLGNAAGVRKGLRGAYLRPHEIRAREQRSQVTSGGRWWSWGDSEVRDSSNRSTGWDINSEPEKTSDHEAPVFTRDGYPVETRQQHGGEGVAFHLNRNIVTYSSTTIRHRLVWPAHNHPPYARSLPLRSTDNEPYDDDENTAQQPLGGYCTGQKTSRIKYPAREPNSRLRSLRVLRLRRKHHALLQRRTAASLGALPCCAHRRVMLSQRNSQRHSCRTASVIVGNT